MFDDEEKDKKEGEVSGDAPEEVTDEDAEDEEEKPNESEEDGYRERDWA